MKRVISSFTLITGRKRPVYLLRAEARQAYYVSQWHLAGKLATRSEQG